MTAILNIVSEVKAAYFGLIKPIADKYSLLLEGKAVSNAPFIGNITIDWNSAYEPSPISPFNLESRAYTYWSSYRPSIRHIIQVGLSKRRGEKRPASMMSYFSI